MKLGDLGVSDEAGKRRAAMFLLEFINGSDIGDILKCKYRESLFELHDIKFLEATKG